MATKTKEFEAFGVQYRTTQFCATDGVEIFNTKGDEIHPTILLSKTEAKYRGSWIKLDNISNINDAVIDLAEVLPPTQVLGGLLLVVNKFNFGFLDGWKSTKVPERFLSGARTVMSKNVSPLIFQLVQDEAATLKELETYYSMEDAFVMFDIAVTKGVNTALANEAATKKNR